MTKLTISRTLWLGFAATAIFITACSAGAGGGATPVALPIPPIDAAQPARIETATFAMG